MSERRVLLFRQLMAAAMFAAASVACAEDLLFDSVAILEWPNSTAMAVNDSLGIVAVGHGGKSGAGVAIFPLSVDGIDTAEPTVIEFALPDDLEEWGSRVLALAFHPHLPLLYVWQDMDSDAPSGKVDEFFDHLAILTFDDAGTVMEQTFLCRGEDYANRQSLASFAIPNCGSRLFIPNVIKDTDSRFQGAIGYFDLDDDGFPVPVPVPIEGEYDERGVNRVEMQLDPVAVYSAIRTGGAATLEAQQLQTLPTGTGYYSVDGETLLFGGLAGIGVWDTADRKQALSEVSIGDWASGELAGHPELPLVYLTSRASGNGKILSMEHADGIPTLIPHRVNFPGATFRSPPVVCGDRQQVLAVGGDQRLYLLDLDSDGRCTGDATMVVVPGRASVRAFAWSEKANRVILAVDDAHRVSQATRANQVLYEHWDFLPGFAGDFGRPIPSHIGVDLQFVEDGESGVAIEIHPTEDRMHNDGLRFDSHPLLVPERDFAIEMRVKPLQESRRIRLMDKMRDHNRATGYMINWEGGNDGTATILVTLGFGRIEDEQNVENYRSKPFEVREDDWHHVAFAYDGAGRVRIFVDDQLLGSETRRGRRSLDRGNQALSIGDRSGATYQGVPARIEQVRIHHSAKDFTK